MVSIWTISTLEKIKVDTLENSRPVCGDVVPILQTTIAVLDPFVMGSCQTGGMNHGSRIFPSVHFNFCPEWKLSKHLTYKIWNIFKIVHFN